MYTVTAFICGGRARPRGTGGSMKYQFVYLNVVAVCLNELDSISLDGPAGEGVQTFPEVYSKIHGSYILKSVYLNVVTVVDENLLISY